MKKILASLLSLTLLCSSVAVFCSAEQCSVSSSDKSLNEGPGVYYLEDKKCCYPIGVDFIESGNYSKFSDPQGKCLTKCKGGYVRGADGNCIPNKLESKTKECSDGHKLIDKHCCPIGYNYVVNNSCSECPANQELVGNECLTKCEDGYVRGSDGNCAKNKLDSKTDAEITGLNNLENFKTTLINLGNKVSAFCNGHQKEIAIGGIATAAVALVGTTIYIFRNEIKDLAKKAGTSMKKVFEKKNDQVKVNN